MIHQSIKIAEECFMRIKHLNQLFRLSDSLEISTKDGWNGSNGDLEKVWDMKEQEKKIRLAARKSIQKKIDEQNKILGNLK